VVEKGVTKLVVPPRQEPLPPKHLVVGGAYLMSKKESSNSGMVVTGALFFNFKHFCVLFDLGAMHSFISP